MNQENEFPSMSCSGRSNTQVYVTFASERSIDSSNEQEAKHCPLRDN